MASPAVSLLTPSDRLAARRFIEAQGLTFEETYDDLVGVFEAESLVATGARAGFVLKMLAIDPGHQGGGLGAVLLHHGINRAARSGHPVVLETFSERAVSFYLRNGFHLLLDDVEPVSGIRFWTLRHPTQA